MTVFDDAIKDIFADTDLTLNAVYNRQTIKVIFDSQFIALGGVATQIITAECLAADAVDMVRGQKIIIADTEYTIIDIQPAVGEGTVLLELSRDSALAASSPVTPEPVLGYRQMDTGGQITSADIGKTIIVNSADPQTLVAPPGSSPLMGGKLRIIKRGSGRLTVQASTGDALDDGSPGGSIYCDDTPAMLDLTLAAANQWITNGTGTWVAI